MHQLPEEKGHLLSMPPEILSLICEHLPCHDLTILECVCHSLRDHIEADLDVLAKRRVAIAPALGARFRTLPGASWIENEIRKEADRIASMYQEFEAAIPGDAYAVRLRAQLRAQNGHLAHWRAFSRLDRLDKVRHLSRWLTPGIPLNQIVGADLVEAARALAPETIFKEWTETEATKDDKAVAKLYFKFCKLEHKREESWSWREASRRFG